MYSPAMKKPAPDGARRLQAEKHLLGRWLAQGRRQGLLAAAPPRAWHTLCAVLSFTCQDGERRFTLEQLALSLAVPVPEAERRLGELAQAQWQGQPLAEPELYPDGTLRGARVALADLLLGINDAAPGTRSVREEAAGQLAAAPTARSEVAAVTAAEPPHIAEAVPDEALRAELLAVGLLPDQAERLLTHFPPERVRRQLAWLPHRAARNPAAFLIKAVAADWPAPKEEG